MQRSTSDPSYISRRSLDPADASAITSIRAAASATKGARWTVDARPQYDALMERVRAPARVTFASASVGGVRGVWVHPESSRPGDAILHFHGGWFVAGSARAYRNFVGHIAAGAETSAFVPDYRLAPEHRFPAAVEDALAVYRGVGEIGLRRIAITGDSAGGNLALVLAALASAQQASSGASLVAAAVLLPVTDLSLSGASYETRADAEPFFTRSQVAEMVRLYLDEANPHDPRASPLENQLSGLPPIRVHVGDDEVLLDDARRYVERAVAAGVDAALDVWAGMPHGFIANVGILKASAQALDAIASFLSDQLRPQ